MAQVLDTSDHGKYRPPSTNKNSFRSGGITFTTSRDKPGKNKSYSSTDNGE